MGLTDRLRDNFTKKDPLRRVKQERENVPDWMPIVGPIAGGVVIVGLLAGGFIFNWGSAPEEPVAGGDSSSEVTEEAIDVDPYSVEETETPGGGSESPVPTDGEDAGSESPDGEWTPPAIDVESFLDQTPVSLEVVSSSMPSQAPGGALAVSMAAAFAASTGDWENVPTSTGAPEAYDQYRGAVVHTESVMLEDPIPEIKEDTQYAFVYDVTLESGEDAQVRFEVRPAGASYEVDFG